jgi:hypothetical protein
MAALSTRRLNAIIEALHHKLAGPIGDSDGDLPRDAYEGALAWAEAKLERRSQAAPTKETTQ